MLACKFWSDLYALNESDLAHMLDTPLPVIQKFELTLLTLLDYNFSIDDYESYLTKLN